MDLNFNDIMDSVTELADSAVKLAKDVASKTGKKTEEIVGASKNKLDTLKLENDIKATKTKLGNAVYEMAVEGITDTQIIDKFVAELNTKYAQLEELKKQAEAMKKTVSCPACKSINSKESYFCSRCGAPLPASNVEEDIVGEDVFDDGYDETVAEMFDAEDVYEQAMTDGADEQTAQAVTEQAAEE